MRIAILWFIAWVLSGVMMYNSTHDRLKIDCRKAYNVYECEYNGKGAYVPKGKDK